jgi:hypothetical protein
MLAVLRALFFLLGVAGGTFGLAVLWALGHTVASGRLQNPRTHHLVSYAADPVEFVLFCGVAGLLAVSFVVFGVRMVLLALETLKPPAGPRATTP